MIPKAQGDTKTVGEHLLADVSAALRARNPIIILVTPEEERVEGAVKAAAAALSYNPIVWDCINGAMDVLGKEVPPGVAKTRSPDGILDAIAKSEDRAVWVLRDFHPFWKSPTVNRAMRNLARALPGAPKGKARTVVVITPIADVPIEFQDHVVVVKWKLPDREEMAGVFDRFLEGLQDEMPAKKSTSPDLREAAIHAALGLSVVQAQGSFSKSVVTCKGRIDASVIAKAKKQAIAADGGMEHYDPEKGGLAAIGGLDGVKSWLAQRAGGFSDRARAFGLRPPKGILLVGHPGCGKSLIAKAIATAWSCPLLRLDMGAAKGGIVGQSEAKIRRCFAIADAMGKVVVWIDEIEKALAGSSGALDGGVSSDALGTLLNWMQERPGEAFVIATANDVSKLPPEVLRKGRFDEIFFVDLPTPRERREILSVCLKKVSRTVEGLDIPKIVSAADGFSGAEIAAMVDDALFAAFAGGERLITTADLVDAAGATVPLSRTAPEKTEALRLWAKTRARAATLPEETEVQDFRETARALDVDVGTGQN